MYTWIIFLHVLSVFTFFLAHGATATVMFKVRGERDPARLSALLDLSPAVSGIMAITLLLILVTGIVGGFMGGWWGHGWIWAALVLLIAITFVMSFVGRLYFDRHLRVLIVLCRRKYSCFFHRFKHRISAIQSLFRSAIWIIASGCLDRRRC